MKRYEVLKTVVILQAVCMVVLTVVVVIRVWPDHNQQLEDRTPTDIGANNGNTDYDGPDGDLKDNSQQIVAKVGGRTVTLAELEEQLYGLHGETVLRELMVRKAIDLEAEASELLVMPEELERELQSMADGYDSEARFYEVMEEQLGMNKEQVLEDVRYRLLLEKITIRRIIVSDEEVKLFIEDHPERFGAQLELHLQWILTESESEAASVLKLLENGEDFAQLARTYSIDDFTADAGGDLGLIEVDDPFYDENMLDTASMLQVGEMAGPVEVDGGYAVIRLMERHVTTGLTGRRLHEEAKKQLALERAPSLNKITDELLEKYEAAAYQLR